MFIADRLDPPDIRKPYEKASQIDAKERYKTIKPFLSDLEIALRSAGIKIQTKPKKPQDIAGKTTQALPTITKRLRPPKEMYKDLWKKCFEELDFSSEKKYRRDLSLHYAYSNIYESGFNFTINSKIWKNVFIELKRDRYKTCYRIEYIKGTAHYWKYHLADSVNPEFPTKLEKELSYMSDKERKVFNYYFYNPFDIGDQSFDL